MSAQLHCFQGGPAPETLATDLRALGQLPPGARDDLWAAVEPILPQPVPDTANAALDRFVATHGVEPELLSRVLGALRVLLRNAARLDVAPELFQADVVALTGDAASVVGPHLAALYGAARARVSQEAIARSVAGHGKTLTGIEWRLDAVLHSNHGKNLRAPVVLLTLHYEERGKDKAVTLQVLPSTLADLKRTLDGIVI